MSGDAAFASVKTFNIFLIKLRTNRSKNLRYVHDEMVSICNPWNIHILITLYVRALAYETSFFKLNSVANIISKRNVPMI